MQYLNTRKLLGKRLPTSVFWPGEFHGLYSLWSCKESDTTERLSLSKGGTRTSVYREMDFDSTVENILSCQTVE